MMIMLTPLKEIFELFIETFFSFIVGIIEKTIPLSNYADSLKTELFASVLGISFAAASLLLIIIGFCISLYQKHKNK